MAPVRVLLLLDQLPQDPASGAARTTRTICEFLASSGRFEVRALATTATEKQLPIAAEAFLRGAGFTVSRQLRRLASGADLLTFSDRGIEYSLLESSIARNTAWEARHGSQFDSVFERVRRDFAPHLIFTYGGHRNMIRRWIRARADGTRIVFAVWNHGYLTAQAMFAHVDAILTPSRFLTEKYRDVVGIESTPLPTPIVPDDVVAPQREPLFLTFVNPSLEKGVMFTARFAEQISLTRPDVPILVVESRGTAGTLVAAGLQGGFDLRRHDNIMVSPGVAQPREIFAGTRVMLAPSVWEEPSGRVASEALVNGIPPIVSDRGGLPEECRQAGVVLPLPKELTLSTRVPVGPDAVQPWVDAALRFVDDEAYYQAACIKAREAGQSYLPESLRDRYVSFFERVLSNPRSTN